MEREELGFPGCITIHMVAIPLTNAAVNVKKTKFLCIYNKLIVPVMM